jgi:excisionase family DNA binding protein
MKEACLGLEPLLLKATEAGILLGLGRSKVFAMVAAGELPVIRIGRSVRIPRQALERWIRDQTIEVGQRSEAFTGNAMKYHL